MRPFPKLNRGDIVISRILKAWRQFWCVHEFDIDQIKRSPPDPSFVACPCCKCQKLFTAPYGLALPGRIVRRGPR